MQDSPNVNPYAPPATEPPPAVGAESTADLASRWARLGAALLDALISAVVTIPPLFLGLGFGGWRQLTSQNSQNPLAAYIDRGIWGATAGLLALGLLAFQSYLIFKRGQTLGKMAIGTRIVTVSGRPLGFVDGVLLRTWLPAGAQLVPVVGSFTSLIDVLFIFRSDKRCLHDLIAGTRVVRLPDR